MALKDIKIPTADVQVTADSSFAVRGLSTFDIEHLVRLHGPSLRELFSEFVNGDMQAVKLADMFPVLKELVSRAPGLVSDIIGLAADANEEEMAILRKLPISILISALGTIAGMTLSIEGDLGKAMEMAIQVLGGANGGMAQILQSLNKP